ncbi:MAG: ACT domain-containing protein [Spirochaetales bacterium]|uniref:ACT domain-containing protein n=1 Tax=Candidatus Thalassospirochaeta sargassi TaxID=3119039 RepID=A0AAJ1IEE7_9SPIO|nr:ACT domain-containing protein [Spirochaetales bacterium]
MALKQISVFLENKSGRLAEVSALISDAGINFRAISIADTADFGILRMIVDKPDDALKLLEARGFTARENLVLGVEVEDHPGGMAGVMKLFDENDVNIEYLYSSLESGTENAVIIFKVEDVQHGINILEKYDVSRISHF